jgi:hypothetical protein
VRRLFGRARGDGEFSAELNSHLQAHIDDNVRAGMSLDEARRTALLTLGGVEMTKDSYRDRRSLPVLERAGRELRQALGRLRRSPAFAAAAILSLALAIGANVSIFAVVERVVLNPLPYPDSHRIVRLDFAAPGRSLAAFSSVSTRE